METTGNIIGEFLGMVKTIGGEILPLAGKALKLSVWVFTGIFILPCVFVAGYIYPKWADWVKEM